MPDYLDVNCNICLIYTNDQEFDYYEIYYKGYQIGKRKTLKESQDLYNNYVDNLKS